MKELDFSLATTQEIIEELAKRAKQKRKQNMQQYGNQKKFADHIGMTHRRYQQFEINGKITLEKFIDVLRGLNALDETQTLLELGDEELFNEKPFIKNTNSSISTLTKNISKQNNKNNSLVNIPNVFD
jgi:transcriptional regulator with XRE-family HTH domain